MFKIGDKMEADPTMEFLKNMRDGDVVIVKPVVSKADPKGAFWCDKPIYLPIRTDDPICAAREFVEQEIMFPSRGEERAKTPLFCNDKREPFTKSQVTASFTAMLKLVVPATEVKHYSFHSYRSYLACSLDAAQCPPEKIKRILRWISDEALMTYVRANEYEYCGWLDKAALSNIQTNQVANLPSPYAPILEYSD